MVPEPDSEPDTVRLESLTYDMSNHRRLLDALLLVLRPARWSIVGFRFVPLLLFAAGVWAVVYGGFYHRIPVSETHEEQFSEPDPTWTPPLMPPGMPAGQPAFLGTDAFGQPTGEPSPPPAAMPPPEAFLPRMIQKVRRVKTTSEEWELVVNRAVTVAGIIRDPQGEIVRVSDAAGGPAFCPS